MKVHSKIDMKSLYLEYHDVVHLLQVPYTMSNQHHSLVFEETFWSNDVVKDVLANMCIYSTVWQKSGYDKQVHLL